MGNTSRQDMGYTFGSHWFVPPAAKRLDGMVGDWDSADGERGFELQFALPIVRVGTQSPGIPKGGPGGRTSCLAGVTNSVLTPLCSPIGKIDSLKSDMRRFDFV
jgi:hypothetical protein